MRSHTGSIFTLGKGSIVSGSSIQNRNAPSSKESVMHGVDDKISKIVWTKNFVDHQGWDINCNVIFQDNASAAKLLNDGRESLGRRIINFDVRLFCMKYLSVNDEVTVTSFPAERMIADCNTKMLVSGKFKMLRDVMFNLSGIHHSQVGQKERVEDITEKVST